MIVSRKAAILAHIAPLPPNHAPSDLEAGDRHCQTKINELGELYKASKQARGGSWVLCAEFHGEVELPDQQKIMENSLAKLGLHPSPLTYPIECQRNLFPFQGTAFIDGSKANPIVYVEDKEVYAGSQWSPLSYNIGATSGSL